MKSVLLLIKPQKLPIAIRGIIHQENIYGCPETELCNCGEQTRERPRFKGPLRPFLPQTQDLVLRNAIYDMSLDFILNFHLLYIYLTRLGCGQYHLTTEVQFPVGVTASRYVLRPAQSSIQWVVRALSQAARLTIHFHLVTKVSKSRL
jgi:hypothetical protein